MRAGSWYIDFTAQDTGMGLYNVKPTEIHPGSELIVDAFTAGTNELVGGRYSSSCCYPSVTIVTSDALGNTDICYKEYDTSSDNGAGRLTGHRYMDVILVTTSAILTYYW
jgi:hypothetical protein